MSTEQEVEITRISIPQRNSTILFISCFVIGIIFDYFFTKGYFGISYPIFASIFFLVYIINSAVKGKINININWLFLIPVFILSLTYAVSDNHVLRTINFLLVPVLFVFAFIMINSSKEISWYKYTFIEVYLKKIANVFDNISSFYSDFFKNRKASLDSTGLAKKIFMGLGISLVLAAVIIGLLVSADAMFSKIVTDMFSFFPQLQIQDWLRHFVIIILSSSLIGGLFYAVIYIKNSQKKSEQIVKKNADIITVSIVLFVLIAVYILFGAVQFIYLFGGESSITSIGITYSSYAVRGFWELVAVAFINLVVILTSLHITKTKTKASEIFIKTLLILINLLTFVLIFSAHTRLFLYEETYGYTQARIYAHLAIIFLFILFIFVAYKIINIKFSFTKASILIWLVLYTGLNLVNSDAFIAKQNILRFENTGKIDLNYIVRELSADAVPEIIEFRNNSDNEIKGEIDRSLKPIYGYEYKDISNEPWFSYNLSRDTAKAYLEEIDKAGGWVEPQKYDELAGPQFNSFPHETDIEVVYQELRNHLNDIAKKEPKSEVFANIYLNKKITVSEFLNIVDKYKLTNKSENSKYFYMQVQVCSDTSVKCGMISIKDIDLTEDGLKKVIAENSMIQTISIWATTANLKNFWDEPGTAVKYIEVKGKGPKTSSYQRYY